MRIWMPVLAVAVCSCAGPSLKEYEDRVERGRARLAAIAKAEYERDRSNQDLLLIYAGLAGGEASPEVDRIRETPGPFAAFLVGKAVICGLAMDERKLPPAEVAHQTLSAMDRAGSSLSSFYRLEWLKQSTKGERAFWRECRSALQDALDRDRWNSPLRDFHLKWFAWLDAHETDSLVKVNADLRVGDGHYLPMFWLARKISGVLWAPVPPDPLVLEVSGLFQKICERLLDVTIDGLEFQTANTALQILLPGRFLGLWRTGDFAAAEGACDSLDRVLDREARYSVFVKAQMKRYEAYPFFWKIGLDRMHEAFLPTIVAARGSEYGGRLTRDFERDEEGLLEGYRSLEAGGGEFLRAWREDLTASSPVITRVLQTAPASPPPPNALRWALRDKDVIQAGAFPADRRTELLKAAFDLGPESDPRPSGLDVYSWLLKEALLRAESVPMEVLESLEVGRLSEHLDLMLILHRRGAPLIDSELQDGIETTWRFAFSSTMKGFCQLLALRTKEDPKAAADMLSQAESYQDGWTTACETLHHVTGQDFGWDLDAWKRWLLEAAKR